jgi:hypothetical protein
VYNRLKGNKIKFLEFRVTMIHRFTSSILKRTWNAKEGPNFPKSHKMQSAHCPGIAMASILYSRMGQKKKVICVTSGDSENNQCKGLLWQLHDSTRRNRLDCLWGSVPQQDNVTRHNPNWTAVVAASSLETLGKIHPGLDTAPSYYNLFGWPIPWQWGSGNDYL